MPKLRPLGLLGSLLYFGIPAAIFSASILGLLPWMVRNGYGGFAIFNVTFGGPLLLMLIASLVAYRLEGHPWTWPAFRDRIRLQRMTPKTWLWTVGLVAVSFAGAPLVGPLAAALSDVVIYVSPPEFVAFMTEMRSASFSGLELQGRWDILVLVLLSVTILNIGGEELWWRGIILPRQELALGKWAWLVNGVLWDLFHIFYHTSLGSVIGYLPITVPLAFVAQLTRNTWPGIIAHWITNSSLLFLLFDRVRG